MARGFFITGTGTEVGKTYFASLFAKELQSRGTKVGVYKPAASGCSGEECVSDDAVRLWEAAGRPLTLDEVCPQRFRAAVAPNVAARMEGRHVDANLLRIGIDPWIAVSDVVLVEGAGGLMSPLSDDDYNADLAADLGFPLIVVAANRLGVINDTLQTVITATVWGDGLEVAGVVLNQASEIADDQSQSTNAEQLSAHLRVPLLGEVGYGPGQPITTIVERLMSILDPPGEDGLG